MPITCGTSSYGLLCRPQRLWIVVSASAPTHQGPGLSFGNYPVDGATERVPTLQSAALPHLRTGLCAGSPSRLRHSCQLTRSRQTSLKTLQTAARLGAKRTLLLRLCGHELRRIGGYPLCPHYVSAPCRGPPVKIRALYCEDRWVEELRQGLRSRESFACGCFLHQCSPGMGRRRRRKNPDVCEGAARARAALRRLRAQNPEAFEVTGSLADLFTLETLAQRLAITLWIGALWSAHNDEPGRVSSRLAGTWAYAVTQPTPAQIFVILILGNYTYLWLHFSD